MLDDKIEAKMLEEEFQNKSKKAQRNALKRLKAKHRRNAARATVSAALQNRLHTQDKAGHSDRCFW